MIHPLLCNVKPNFYPRSPCGERLSVLWMAPSRLLFLSTLSLRRATALGLPGWLRTLISIHALLAESDANNQKARQGQHISIHALLAESDYILTISICIALKFLSTLSLRRATRYGRPIDVQLVFLSTLSLRRATRKGSRRCVLSGISIHALLAESDSVLKPLFRSKKISIHALLAESDYILTILICTALKFLSTLSLRRATAKVHKTVGYFCAYETNFMEIASSC